MFLEIEEYFKLCRGLEDKHSIFLKMFEIGKPIFTKDVPTAAISFNPEKGNYLSFLFNPYYWNSLDDYNKQFVICHEMLHVILNHGIRSKDSENKGKSNIALDIVVNHILVNKFLFNRSWIKNEDNLCWVDTCFDKNDNIKENENYEYYFKKLLGLQNAPQKQLLDDHSRFPSKGIDKVLKDVNSDLKPEDKNSIKDILSKTEKAGDEKGLWTFDFEIKKTKKKKWETVIKNVISNKLRIAYKDIEQWARVNRRIQGFETDLMIPSEMEIEDKFYDKIEIWFYLDTSGSCFHLGPRFINAAMSIPTDKFKVRLFCFDTVVYDVSLRDKKLYGNGGTKFHIIEKHIQETIKKDRTKYPKVVFILTDGVGNVVNPEYPERWYWFLAELSKLGNIYNKLVPLKSKEFILSDFE